MARRADAAGTGGGRAESPARRDAGGRGLAPDGIQYFEVWPASRARKVLFVRVGQDEPLFDEKNLRLIAP